MTINQRLATGASITIPTDGRNIHIENIFYSADATGKLTFSDGLKTYVIDAAVGFNIKHKGMVFDGSGNVTITCAGANITLAAEVYLR